MHRDPACTKIRRRLKEGQRDVPINRSTISEKLRRFDDDCRFGANPETNDMWLTVDFGDLIFERAVVLHVQKRLGNRYRRILNANVEEHC